jgi:hypothetical protein
MAERNGFTMVSDYLAWKYQDYLLAVIYAKIERFCNLGGDKICDAAIETFEQELVVSDTAINPRIDLLVSEGYVIDSTPDLVNRSHNRTVTDKLQKEENDFHEWAESYRREEIEKGNKLPSYFDCFVVYANLNEIDSFLSAVNKPKKARGRNGGRKPKYQRNENQTRLANNLSKITDNVTKITEKSTVDYDNTIDTKETVETFQQNSEISEGRTPSSFPPEPVETNVSSVSKEVIDSLLKEIDSFGTTLESGESPERGDSLEELNLDVELLPVSSVAPTVAPSSTQESTPQKVASSDVDTSSESISYGERTKILER